MRVTDWITGLLIFAMLSIVFTRPKGRGVLTLLASALLFALLQAKYCLREPSVSHLLAFGSAAAAAGSLIARMNLRGTVDPNGGIEPDASIGPKLDPKG